MLEVRIVTPHGSLYYAGESQPYDLETLWEHVRDVASDGDPRDVKLDVVVDDDAGRSVARWIDRIAANGVRVRLLYSRLVYL